MTLTEYKRKKLAEVDYFLRGIKFGQGVNRGMLKIENVKAYDEEVNVRFLNRRDWFPLLKGAVYNIFKERNVLENQFIDDITGATTLEEVDKAVETFIRKVMQILDKLKILILEDVKVQKNVSVIKSFETSSLEFMEVCVGDKIYPWSSTYVPNRSISQKDLREKEKVDSVVLILAYIYILPISIEKSSELRSNMLDFIHELESCFKHGSDEYKRIANYYKEIWSIKQGEEVGIKKFQEVLKYVDFVITNFWNENELSDENNRRYNKIIELYKIAQMLVPISPSDENKHTK